MFWNELDKYWLMDRFSDALRFVLFCLWGVVSPMFSSLAAKIASLSLILLWWAAAGLCVDAMIFYASA